MSKSVVLETEDIVKKFGKLVANDGISLSIEKGEIRGIIGPNGSGKTTFFNVLSGFLKPNRGSVSLNGKNITSQKPYYICHHGLVRTFQIAAPFENLTVKDNLMVTNTPDQIDNDERSEELLKLFELSELRDHQGSELSGGQQKILGFIRGLMFDPDCMLLDEPTAGVNPVLEQTMVEKIRQFNEQDVTFVIIEHDMELIEKVSDRVTVFNNGQVVTEGPMRDVVQDTKVQESYLGGGIGGLSEVDEDISRTADGEDDDSSGPERSLRGEDIVTGYGKNEVLHGVSAENHEGVTAILGPNGSGKSTLMKALNGQLSIWEGSLYLDGEDVTDLPSYKMTRRGVITLPQNAGLFTTLSVEENLRMGGVHVEKQVVDERIQEVLEMFPDLADKMGNTANQLSGGQQMMVSIGRSVVNGADIFLLDEPSAGLAPYLIDDVFDMVRKLGDQEGASVILIEQNVQEALKISDHAYLMAQGEIQFDGPVSELLEHEELLELYLGL